MYVGVGGQLAVAHADPAWWLRYGVCTPSAVTALHEANMAGHRVSAPTAVRRALTLVHTSTIWIHHFAGHGADAKGVLAELRDGLGHATTPT
jgi:hypothetical protein